MPLEQDKVGFLPSDFNLLWPLARDLISRGDDHLRLIKKASANLQKLTEDEITLLKSYFDLTHRPVAAKLALKALEADTITGVQLDKFALKDGTYEKLRARATTAEDVGLEKVENYGVASSLIDSDELYVRASLLNFLYAQLTEEIRKRQPPDFTQFARKTGTYEHLRARGTTKEDVGLGLLENLSLAHTITEDPNQYASAFALATAYNLIKQSVDSGNTAAVYASGITSDNFSFLMTPNGADRFARTYSMYVPYDKILWRMPAVYLAVNGVSGPCKLRFEAWLSSSDYPSNVVSQEFELTGNEKFGETVLTNMALVGTTDGVGSGTNKTHTCSVYGKLSVISGDASGVSLFYRPGQGSGQNNGMMQYSIESNLIKVS